MTQLNKKTSVGIFESEQALIKALRSGDPLASKQWFENYYPRLFAIALKKARNLPDAQELVQETFINCLRNLHFFRGNSKLSTWMISILNHEIADYYRKIYAKKAIKTLPLGDFLVNLPVADSHEISAKVRLILGKMVKSKRELLLSKYVDKLKVKQIAQKTGKTVKAIESELFRAREEFRYLYLAEE